MERPTAAPTSPVFWGSAEGSVAFAVGATRVPVLMVVVIAAEEEYDAPAVVVSPFGMVGEGSGSTSGSCVISRSGFVGSGGVGSGVAGFVFAELAAVVAAVEAGLDAAALAAVTVVVV